MGKHTVVATFSDGIKQNILMDAGETVLDAAEKQGVFLANDCREGVCGVCTCQSKAGDFEMSSKMALSSREQAEGKVLPCTLSVASDVELSFDYPSDFFTPKLKHNFKATLRSIDKIAETTIRVVLDAEPLPHQIDYASGQFVSMQIPGTHEWRSYSMANTPNSANRLEFIVRLLPDGVMSRYLTTEAKVGDTLVLSPPKGSFYLREVTRPLLLIAGGTGLSAILSMLRSVSEGEHYKQTIRLIYGVNTPADVCETEQLDVLKNQLPHFSYDIICTASDGQWNGPVGYVTALLSNESVHYGEVDAYLCGPPPMIDAVNGWFDQSGLESQRVYAEKFTPASTKKTTLNIVKGAKPHRRAVVVGGSVGGIIAAKVLSEQFDEVIVLERDSGHSVDETREMTGQSHHAHHLLQRGQRELDSLFPGFLEELKAAGARVYDASKDYRTFQNGSWKIVTDSGISMYAMRRCLLETVMRQQLDKVSNIDYRYDVKVGDLILDASGNKVVGLHYETLNGHTTLDADLVVDCSGKNTRLYQSLAPRGYPQPEESAMEFDIYYHTYLFKVAPENLPDWSMMTIYNHRPHEKQCGYAAFYSEDRSVLLITICSYGCDEPVRDYEGFLEYTRNLQQPHIYELIQKCERITDLKTFKYPKMFHRHYEKLDKAPQGFIALGDSFSSADPISGAGMTKATLEGKLLAEVLVNNQKSLANVHTQYHKKAAKLFDYIWFVIGEQGLRFPWVKAKRPFYQKVLNCYVDHVMKMAAYDKEVFKKYLMVVHFNETVSSLMTPTMLFKVAKSMMKNGVTVPYIKPKLGEIRHPKFEL